jgi:hypothetical protein
MADRALVTNQSLTVGVAQPTETLTPGSATVQTVEDGKATVETLETSGGIG